MHHTSYYSFNKSYILFDISQTVRYFGVDGAVPNRAKQTATVAEYPDQIHKTLPLPISKWLWEQTFRKIPAFVINLDVRETRSIIIFSVYFVVAGCGVCTPLTDVCDVLYLVCVLTCCGDF